MAAAGRQNLLPFKSTFLRTPRFFHRHPLSFKAHASGRNRCYPDAVEPRFLKEGCTMLNTLLAMLMTLQVDAAKDAPRPVIEGRAMKYTGGEYNDEEFKYSLIRPLNPEPGKKYPLVVFLHGAGERGDDDKAQLKFLPEWMAKPENWEKYPCYLLAPQCRRGKKWVEVDWGDKLSVQSPRDPGDQMKVAMKMLDSTIKMNPIDTNRIYLTGLSMGGYGSWDWAMREPDRFAAVVPICGGGDESKADKLVNVPIWAYHGDADDAVPVERSRRMIEAIKKAGGNPKYTELPGVGHNSWTPAYTDPNGPVPWMFSQRKK
jgi:predicted peptidase